jgi:hypothetical protein
MLVNTSRNESLIKYEEELAEQSQNKETSYDIHYTTLITNGYYNNMDNTEYINRIKGNMNKLSKLLSDKLKEANKAYAKPVKKEVDNRQRFISLNDAIQNVKLLLNKK